MCFAAGQYSVVVVINMASSCTVSSTLCEDQTLAESEEFKSRSRTTSSKSPWNCNVTKPTPITSFEEVMSEQLAVELHLSDELELAKSEHSLDHDLDCTAGINMIFLVEFFLILF